MRSRSAWWGLAILAGAILIAIRIFPPSADSTPSLPEEKAPKRSQTSSADSTVPGLLVSKAAGKMIEADWNDLLDWIDREPKPTDADIRQRLLALREAWAEMDPIVLAETIGRLLDSGRDTPTGMKFKVGLHGFLDGWPTLRVFLLDALAAAEPDTAAAVARRLLDQTGSPEEFAVALRSLTREGFARADDGELQQHFRVLLDKREWQSSAGFAESLDLARTVGTGGIASDLLRWNGDAELKSMALHEFAADHPKEMSDSLLADTQTSPSLRATLMARLDPQFPDQAAAVDQYLRDPARTNEEATVFLKAFPLRSATTGARLYGLTPAPYQRDQITAGDRAALDLVKGWLADPALETLRPELTTLQKRLDQWVEVEK